jgi:hypothetical protein
LKIYQLNNDFRYQILMTKNGSDLYILKRLGCPLTNGWEKLEVYVPASRKDRPSSDFPGFLPNAPVFGPKAKEIFQDVLEQYGEFLELDVEGRDNCFLYNTLNTLTALDEINSDVIRFTDGRIMDIKKYVFVEELVRDEIIFKIPEDPGSIFVSDEFVSIYKNNVLSGLVFKEVWSNEQ